MDESGDGFPGDGKLIVLNGVHFLPRFKTMVSQADLVEERQLQREWAEKARRLQHKRDEIRRALELGVPVEPGILKARLVQCQRCPVAPTEYVRLVVE